MRDYVFPYYCFGTALKELAVKFKAINVLHPSGWRSTDEDAEHGKVPANRYGHGSPYGKEEPEQLESPLPLVTMETALRDGP